MTPDPNPFSALSLIVAPAILTSACSLLVTRLAVANLQERAASAAAMRAR